MSKSATSRAPYRAEIDGLRAIAVLPVILFHAGFEAFSGGFVGVDVFFVISGYLITTIILAEQEAGSFSLPEFYMRRARRILPALVFVIVACIPFAWMWLLPTELKDFALSVLSVSTFWSNFFFWSQSGYFDTANELKPLLHTWSLAVEEQYYLLFPPCMLFAWRLGRRAAMLLFAAVACISLLAAQVWVSTLPAATFYLLPTRGWELLLGVLVAFHVFHCGRGKSQALSILGMAMIAVSVFAFDLDTPFPSFYALLPTLGAALIILYAAPGTSIQRVLAYRPIVGLGLISYSAYLWHQPLFAFARIRFDVSGGSHAMLLLAAASLLFAYFSWRCVELPFRVSHHGLHISTRPAVLTFSATVTGLIVFGLAGHLSGGFAGYRSIDTVPDYLERVRLLEEQTNYDLYELMEDNGECVFWDRTISDDSANRFERCAIEFGKAVLVIGDSHSMNLFNIIAKAEVHPFVFGISQGGCRATDNKVHCQPSEIAAFLTSNVSDIGKIVYHQTGAVFAEDENGSWRAREIYRPGTAYSIAKGTIDGVIDYLAALSSKFSVAWVGPWTESRVNAREALKNDAGVNRKSIEVSHAVDQAIKDRLASTEAGQKISYFSLVDEFAIGPSSLWEGDCLRYMDDNHFSKCGEDLLAERHQEFWQSLVTPAERAPLEDETSVIPPPSAD